MTIDLTPLTATRNVFRLSEQLNSRLEDLSIQIASGDRHQDFQGLAEEGNVERLISLQESLGGIDSYVRSNNLAVARTETARQAIDEIQELADEFSQIITSRRNSASGHLVEVDLLGTSLLDQISNNLNIRFDGRYLFGGSKTDTPPVTNIQTSNLDSTRQPTARYYAGDTVITKAQSSQTQQIEYGILANDQAFQDLIGAIHLGIQGHQQNNNDYLAEATDLLNRALGGIPSVRADASSSIARLESINQDHSDARVLLEQNVINVSSADIVEATTLFSEIEAQLSGSFLALSRLNNLTLVNFLN